jgi:hypothetical protein
MVSSEDAEDGDEGLSDWKSTFMAESVSVGGRVLSGSQDGNCASPAGPYWVAAAGIRPKTLVLMGRIRRNHGYRSILLPAILWWPLNRVDGVDVACRAWWLVAWTPKRTQDGGLCVCRAGPSRQTSACRVWLPRGPV